jgi:hypothetical protein
MPHSLQSDMLFDGGVEEKKEEPLSPSSHFNSVHAINGMGRRRYSSEEDIPAAPSASESNPPRSHWERIAQLFVGSCGTAFEAASLFVQGHSCRWPMDLFSNNHRPENEGLSEDKPALSIADELRLLAIKEGRYPGEPLQTERRGDIPRFLGEDAVYSFEDDDVSALSQHTLEDMARNGVIHPLCRRQHSTNSQYTPPTPSKLLSASSSSDRGKARLPR